MAAEPSYVEKWKGMKTTSGIPYPKDYVMVLFNGLGGAIAMAVLLLIARGAYGGFNAIACFIPPFAASCMIIFALTAAPIAQPRNVIGGYFFSGLIGFIVYNLVGTTAWWAIALSVGLAITVMVFTKTVHPPAGVSAALPFLNAVKDWTWILWPNVLGAVILVIIGLLYVNLKKDRKYPFFWW